MKAFYSEVAQRTSPSGGSEGSTGSSTPSGAIASSALIAVYEAPGAAPRVERVPPAPIDEYIEAIATRVHRLSGEAGGSLPYTVVREVAENLIHAGFAEPVISILDDGTTVRFADQGPGIPQKERALLPGFTTASGPMKEYIRGVGSGLPIVRDFLVLSGGDLAIEDNLGHGSVVTISSGPRVGVVIPGRTAAPKESPAPVVTAASLLHEEPPSVVRPRLSTRQTQVLALVLESGSAGPSLVAKELSVALSTAYRDLALLEELELISADGGKRTVTRKGLLFLDELAAR